MSTIEFISSIWAIAEPAIALFTLGTVLRVFYQTRKAKKARLNGNYDGYAVIALQVGRPVAEAVQQQFGQLDELIVFDGQLVTDHEYKELANRVYQALCKHQGEKIQLVLSGPVGLSFTIGQLVGLHHFDVQVHQFDPGIKGYKALPVPERSWLKTN
jgi:hypothetical protein